MLDLGEKVSPAWHHKHFLQVAIDPEILAYQELSPSSRSRAATSKRKETTLKAGTITRSFDICVRMIVIISSISRLRSDAESFSIKSTRATLEDRIADSDPPPAELRQPSVIDTPSHFGGHMTRIC